MSALPATPQRITSHTHSHSVSVSLPHGLSPLSPYTPLSLRSFASTSSGSLNPSPSSTLATPASIRNLHNHSGFSSPPITRVKKISWASPSPAGHSPSDSLPSIADLARNWRSRANENGIKVANNPKQSIVDDFSLLDDEDASFASEQVCDEDEALLPAPFMSTQRRRALSHAGLVPQYSTSSDAPYSAPRARGRPPLAPLSPVTRRMAPSSPLQARRSSLVNHQNVMATPPPNRQLAERLRLKGSLTDPAQLRRREVYDAVLPPSDVSFDRDLFDIHEDEHDEDYELAYNSYRHDLYDYHYQPEPSVSMRETHSDIEEEQYEVEYPTLPPQLKQNPNQYYYHFQEQQLLPPSYNNHQTIYPPGLVHPAASRGPAYTPSMSQVLNVPMYHDPQLSPQYPIHPITQLAPAHIPMPLSRTQALTSLEASLPASSNASSKVSTPVPVRAQISNAMANPKCCSICARRPPSLTRLAILTPCAHALCPACLTSALNIVGEKDMECAGCRAKVADFKLVSITADEGVAVKVEDNSNSPSKAQEPKQLTRDNLLYNGELNENQTFDISDLDETDFFSDENLRASTPPPKVKGMGRVFESGTVSGVEHAATKYHDPVVLRIDNVPWDITPPRISAWLDQPIVRVHVLLDKKGKTMSHAFVEVEDEIIAGKILRGEVQANGLRRGTVLGKGKRARGVTVTRSSQGELMSALFPSWLGSFDGSRPSLAGIDNDRVVAALESGLMTESEVACLLYLIRSPDAHFLKVPSLPFHSLVSLLAKFPADIDSRVFWSSSLRDVLFDVVVAAIQVLITRIEQRKNENDDGAYPFDLVDTLIKVASACQVFTAQQKSQLAKFSPQDEPARPLSACGSDSDAHSSVRAPDHADPTDADVEDEDGENDPQGDASLSEESHPSSDEVRTPSSTTAANSSSSSSPEVDSIPSAQDHMRDDIAREFGVEAQLVEALIQRLSMTQR
ncbi:hypothetical protein F5051DRAFT_230511 [Lentinula edodes]|nr:hypothetical protein F5051DRAFT_230511 [Lentinula edodes]